MRLAPLVVLVGFAIPLAMPSTAEACGGAIRLARSARVAFVDSESAPAMKALDDGRPKLALRRAARIRNPAARKRAEGLALAALGRHKAAVLALDEAYLKGIHDERMLIALIESLEATKNATRAEEIRTRLRQDRELRHALQLEVRAPTRLVFGEPSALGANIDVVDAIAAPAAAVHQGTAPATEVPVTIIGPVAPPAALLAPGILTEPVAIQVIPDEPPPAAAPPAPGSIDPAPVVPFELPVMDPPIAPSVPAPTAPAPLTR